MSGYFQYMCVCDWMGSTIFTFAQVRESLVRLGYTVQITYQHGGITVGIVKDGRGQLHSGVFESVVLYELMARMIESGDLPATAVLPALPSEVQNAGQEVEINQAAESLRGPEKEGLPEAQGGGNLEQHSKAPKAKKVKA